MKHYINGISYEMSDKEYQIIITTLSIGREYLRKGHYKRAKSIFDQLNGMIQMLEVQNRLTKCEVDNIYDYIAAERSKAMHERVFERRLEAGRN